LKSAGLSEIPIHNIKSPILLNIEERHEKIRILYLQEKMIDSHVKRTYWAGNVLGGIPRYIEGFLSAVAAVTTIHIGNRLQNILEYFWKVSIEVGFSSSAATELVMAVPDRKDTFTPEGRGNSADLNAKVVGVLCNLLVVVGGRVKAVVAVISPKDITPNAATAWNGRIVGLYFFPSSGSCMIAEEWLPEKKTKQTWDLRLEASPDNSFGRRIPVRQLLCNFRAYSMM
jgi:hypothetical protein